MYWYLKVLKNYFNFQGRARRKEYWMFVLFNIIISIVLVFVDKATGTYDEQYGAGLIGGLYALAVLIPGIAVSVRRLHDRNKSGWWLLIGFVPLIGAIVLLVWFVIAGDQGSNRFGADPKAGEEGAPVVA
ncbi:uncharacterized membrane protein YhaH (DUF805 family) [Luteimonas cucumeris]|uniref:Uncharacterized membrane protein YhaH (DUF805 family) n=1 Tax=Luteimonas cucumeris TaxID=985012 RepID=A0A562KX39_9GAMM|nr:DUF805 domain-containing protein [Luteimonas cucumeris]TWH99990.1 uncharacterized membrane protein YhaH (DUF805 family) [Luteimonas cucumeris]